MKIHFYIFFFLGISFFGMGQSTDCECDIPETIKICYYSEADICPPFTDCRYTLDGQFMNTGLRQKLLNPALFGNNGIVDCPMELEPIIGINSVDFIENRGCNIVFIGVFAQQHFSGLTAIPDSELSFINEWSEKCSRNLTIVSQAEAQTWGYDYMNGNINPNTPDPDNELKSIFDGPFGIVNSFNQGGSFQGHFTGFPSGGYDVLARDFLGRPTIVLDQASNDILLADIGILCNGGAVGSLSTGSNVVFDNDILAANIFALGCQIATQRDPTGDFVDLCEGESHTLPSGEIVDVSGIFFDTLLNVHGCDSIIVTRVDVYENYDTDFVYNGCSGDEFSVTVGSQVFDENNLTGSVFLGSSKGCDSLVNISLSYLKQDTTYLEYEICNYESVMVDGVSYNETVSTIIYADDTDVCDSVIFLDIFVYPEALTTDIGDGLVIDLTEEGDHIIDIFDGDGFIFDWAQEDALSCTDCAQPILLEDRSPSQLDVVVSDDFGCVTEYVIPVLYKCEPLLPNIINTNSQTPANQQFTIYTQCRIDDFKISIFDRWGGMVYQSEDISATWDGTFNGSVVASGVYVYQIDYSVVGLPYTQLGDVTVIGN